jgi:hypothetical protein
MPAAGPFVSTPIEWVIRPVTRGGITFPVARLRVRLFFRSRLPGSPVVREQCWLDTGAPLCVIPLGVQQRDGLVWQALPGGQTTWVGQPCDLGRIDYWLPTHQPPYVRGPLSMLAKFARSDPPGNQIPVLLGLEFLLALQAATLIVPPPQQGTMSVP